MRYGPDRAIVATLEIHVAVPKNGEFRANSEETTEADENLYRIALAMDLANRSNPASIRPVERGPFENASAQAVFIRPFVIMHQAHLMGAERARSRAVPGKLPRISLDLSPYERQIMNAKCASSSSLPQSVARARRCSDGS